MADGWNGKCYRSKLPMEDCRKAQTTWEYGMDCLMHNWCYGLAYSGSGETLEECLRCPYWIGGSEGPFSKGFTRRGLKT